MRIIVKNVLVEVHHSIGMVKHYYGPLRRVYSIITTEIPGIEPDLASFKTINNPMGLNRLVSTLLVFSIYPKITEQDTPSPSITQCAIAIRKAIDEVRKCPISQQVNNVLNTYNGPSTGLLHNLPINSPLLVYQKGNVGQSEELQELYNFFSIQDE